MSRWRRRLAIVAVLVVVAIVGLRFYLRSGAAGRLVASQLGDILETTVAIDSLRAALAGDTIVGGLKLYNDGDDTPYLEADEVTVDVSVANLAGGKRLPDRIDIHGVRLRLRFDREGKLLTKLPKLPRAGRLPALRLRGLELTLAQDGRPPLTLRRATAMLSPDEEENLSGEIDDPDLGRFALSGRFGQGKLHLKLAHRGLALTPRRFRELPFVPRAITRRLEAEGDVPLEIALWLGPERPRCRYRVAFGPARTRLLQDDRPPFAASGVRGVAEGDDDGRVSFKGGIRDPRWGDWAIAAEVVDDAVDLRLSTADAALDPARLVGLPFVPKAVWKQVQGTGRTPADVRVRLFLDKPDLHYRVELSPRLSALRIGALDLDMADASGRVVIEDNLVRLSGWKARAAAGEVTVSGDLDFRAEPPRLRFDLGTAGVRLSSLPASWGIPPAVDGRLTGAAKLTLITHDSGVVTRGDGAATLDEVSLAGYRVAEPVRLALRDADLEASLALPRVDLAELGRRAGATIAGRASLTARASVPVDRAGDRAAWRGAARVESAAVEVAGHLASDVAMNLVLAAGRLRVADARAGVAGGVVTAALDVDLADLTGQGALAGRGLDFGPWLRVETLAANVSLDRERVELRDVRAATHGGDVTGWVRLALADGSIRTELLASRIDAGRLARALARTPVPVEGTLSAQVSGVYRPGDGPAMQLDLASARVAVLGVPARNLRGRLDLAAGRATYQLSGETLAGRVSVEGTYPPAPGESAGQLRLERLRLTSLWEALGQSERLRELEGIAALSLPYRHDGPGLALVGRGRFELRDLRWQGGEVMDHFSGDFRAGADGLTLRDAGGVLAGGSLRLSGAWRFDDPSRGWFDVRLLGAELGRLSADRDWLDLVQGPLDLSLRGTFGAEWRGSGAASLSRGKVFGVEVSDWRLPVEFSFAPSTRQAEVSVRESSARVGTGRAQLRLGLRYSGGWRVEGQLLLLDAGLRSLAGLVGDVTSFARGRVTGRVDFAAAELRSLADLTASVQAKLNDAQALQLPVLKLLVPHLLPGQAALDFQAGELRGRLSGGVFRVSELTLDSSLLLLLLQGSVTLQGRLDLDVTAQTSSTGVDPLLLGSLLRKLPVVGPVPVGLVFRVTELLSDRVVHLRVGGTVRSPRVQVEPLRLLSDQAARYFLEKAVQVTKP